MTPDEADAQIATATRRGRVLHVGHDHVGVGWHLGDQGAQELGRLMAVNGVLSTPTRGAVAACGAISASPGRPLMVGIAYVMHLLDPFRAGAVGGGDEHPGRAGRRRLLPAPA